MMAGLAAAVLAACRPFSAGPERKRNREGHCNYGFVEPGGTSERTSLIAGPSCVRSNEVIRAVLPGSVENGAQKIAPPRSKPADPREGDPENDELIVFFLFPFFFSAIYLARRPGTADALAPRSVERLIASPPRDSRHDLLFDKTTREQGLWGPAASPRANRLRHLVAGSLPPLEPLPADHVLTKSTIVLPHAEFPWGRWAGRQLWVLDPAA